ncbi:MAG: MFS transporter [Acidobacteria bacterium]|nr:MFS transporter [Acidobacteriota bacterium]
MQSINAVSAQSIATPKSRSAWFVVGASSIGLFLHFGSLLVNSFGVLLTTLCDQFHWSRTQVSFAFTLATLTAMLTMPLTGWLTDRLGARRLILFCTTVFGVLFAALALLTGHLWQLYVIYLLLGLVGPGTSAVPHASLITRWFTKRRGLALGFAMCGTVLGGVIWPSATQKLLDQFNWRMTYAVLGAAVLFVAVPLLLAFLKEPPAQTISMENSAAPALEGLSRKDAIRSGVLWLMIVAFFIVSATIQACMIHLVPMLKDRGMTPTKAAFAASLFGVAGMAGRLGTGYLLDLVSSVRVPVLAFCCVAAGIFLLFFGAAGWSSFVAAMLIGFGYGAESATIPYLVGQYFGLRSFGEIYSYLFITVPLGGALGPVLMGAGFDRLGSYQTGLLLSGIITVIAALLLLALKAYPTFNSQSVANKETT